MKFSILSTLCFVLVLLLWCGVGATTHNSGSELISDSEYVVDGINVRAYESLFRKDLSTRATNEDQCPPCPDRPTEYAALFIGIFVSALIFLPLGYLACVVISNRRSYETEDYIGLDNGDEIDAVWSSRARDSN
eukprot:CFRG4219T1